MSEHGFEYTPMGIVPMGMGQQVATGIDLTRGTGNATQAEADAFEARLGGAVRALTAPAVIDAPQAPQSAAVAPSLTPTDLLRAARARIKALDAELRRLTAVRRERDELKRLVDAAKAKPAARVRSLRTVTG